MDTDGPYTVWFEDSMELRTRIKTFKKLIDAERKALRVFNVTEAEMGFGASVQITDGRGETISNQLVQ